MTAEDKVRALEALVGKVSTQRILDAAIVAGEDALAKGIRLKETDADAAVQVTITNPPLGGGQGKVEDDVPPAPAAAPAPEPAPAPPVAEPPAPAPVVAPAPAVDLVEVPGDASLASLAEEVRGAFATVAQVLADMQGTLATLAEEVVTVKEEQAKVQDIPAQVAKSTGGVLQGIQQQLEALTADVPRQFLPLLQVTNGEGSTAKAVAGSETQATGATTVADFLSNLATIGG